MIFHIQLHTHKSHSFFFHLKGIQNWLKHTYFSYFSHIHSCKHIAHQLCEFSDLWCRDCFQRIPLPIAQNLLCIRKILFLCWKSCFQGIESIYHWFDRIRAYNRIYQLKSFNFKGIQHYTCIYWFAYCITCYRSRRMFQIRYCRWNQKGISYTCHWFYGKDANRHIYHWFSFHFLSTSPYT